MSQTTFRALDDIHCGGSGIFHAGDILPATYLDSVDQEQPVDFDRLLELGIVQDASLPYGEDAPDGADADADAPSDAPEELGKLKVEELRAIAAAEGIEGAGDLKKAELVDAIEQHRSAASE